MIDCNHTDIRELFAGQGIKVTPQRIAVYEALSQLGHANAEEVTEKVHTSYPSITVGTIYNVLECLVNHSLIRKINTSDNKMFFDISTHDHHHILCRRTGRIVDFGDERLTRLIQDYIEQEGIKHFELEGIQVQLTGQYTK